MKRPLALAATGALVLAAGVAVVVVARAQPRSFPDPGSVVPSGMTAQTQEPPTGFTGACLVDYNTYQPTLPLICYTPTPAPAADGGAAADAGGAADAGAAADAGIASSAVRYGAGTTTFSFPAKLVFRPYATAPASYDSYQTLVTCYPHDSTGACPQQSFAVSHSCCDYGTSLISLDGQTATGLANFR